MLIVPALKTSVGTDDPATTLLQVKDPWERSRLAEELARRLHQARTAVLRVRQEAVLQLVTEHKAKQTSVARHLGLTKGRINQLVAPERPAAEKVPA